MTLLEGLLPDLEVVRKDFPILERRVAGDQPLVYLDSANTSQKPQVVIDAMVDHLERHNANVARAMHTARRRGRPTAFEAARDKVALVPQRALARRGDLHQERHRGHQPGRQHDGVAGPARGRRRRPRRHHRDGAPLQHRAVAAAHRAQGCRAALVRPHRRRPARPVEHRRADHREHQGRLPGLGLQHARHHQPGRGDRPPRPRGRRARACSTPRRPPRSCRSTCRPSTATSSSSPATRSPARPASACSGAGRTCSASCRRSSVAAR